MASAKSVRLNLVADVTDYGIEEYEESFGIFERSSESFEDDEVFVQSPRETSDYGDCGVSDVVAAVYRARKLRASVEWDLKQSTRSGAHRSYQTESTEQLGEHAPGAYKSASLVAQFWRRFGTPSNLGTSCTKGKNSQSKNAHEKSRWGSMERLQFKHHFMKNKAKEDAWTQSFLGVGPSMAQASASADAWGPASVSASRSPLPSPDSSPKRAFWFRARLCPEVPT
eukprot:TRINITY_DN14443_c0_g2_i4.p1 TRINITY_DN14443_c0_g2~~TRINITY_DN14443_c0_g2_i4.p1  ORF type:complete len:226 (+),score=27.02 TRINITY_DN14443_c0_g2_i4:103-780(+)